MYGIVIGIGASIDVNAMKNNISLLGSIQAKINKGLSHDYFRQNIVLGSREGLRVILQFVIVYSVFKDTATFNR